MRKFLTPGKAAAAAFLLSLVYWAFRFIGRLPAVTDEILFSYPSQAVNLSLWKQGLIPLWDPFTGCGMPQLANDLSACLYPPFWIFNLTGLSHWLVWMCLLHTAFCFLGFYLWGRSQKISGTWAVLAAASFAGSLHFTRIWAYPMFSAAQAWTPWVFYMAARFLETSQRRWWLGLVITLAMQLLAGYPFFSFYALLFLFAWVYWSGKKEPRGWAVVGGVIVALGLAAAQVLPFLDYLSYSMRGGWGLPEKFPYFSRSVEFLTLFSPTALGIPGTTAYQGQEPNACFMMYFGLIPLAAWVWGFFMPRTTTPRFWTWSSLLWLVWMMGGVFPLFRIIPEGFLETLNPSKAIGIFLLAALTAASTGLSRFFQTRTQGCWMNALRWGITLVWMADILLVPLRTVFPVKDPFLEPNLVSQAHQIQEAAQGQRMVSLHVKKKLLVEGGAGDSFQGAADLWAGSLLANANEVWGLRSSHAYVSTWTRGMESLWKAFNQSASYDSRLPDLAGVKALDLPVELDSKHYSLLENSGNDHLMVNRNCLPDVWIAGDEMEFTDTPSLLAQMVKEKSAGLNTRNSGEWAAPQTPQTVYLVKDAWLNAPQRSLPISESLVPLGWERKFPTRGSFKGDFGQNNRAGNDAWLIWNEAFTPGWKAWLDGKPASIVKAFGFFMAVAAPDDGIHEVNFRFEPVSFRLGFFLSMISGIGLIVFVWKRKETRKSL